MSDELPDTPDKGIRAFLGALGFIVMLIGAEMMAEKDGARFKLGLVLVLAGLPIFLSAAIWRFVRQYLSANVLIDLRNIAARAARGLRTWCRRRSGTARTNEAAHLLCR
jgi:hypothetical protein